MVPFAFAQESVVNSPHNLSATGPGTIRAASEQQVCIFCHTPHHASPIQPLWNRYTPPDAYIPYTSRSMEAEPGQPTGTSKMCLSCHDGTIALGAVVSRSTPIPMAGGISTIPQGSRGNLGTDLSDDHPISFRYTSSLAARNPKLKMPGQIPHALRLDHNQELQCTTCHDPHDNALGMFLVMHNNNSELCRACHQIDHTTVPGHSDCNACHTPHSAPSGPYLLRGRTVTQTCLNCHGSTPSPGSAGEGRGGGAPNIAVDINKMSTHDTNRPIDPADPIPHHSTCTNCHDPHTMKSGGGGWASSPSRSSSIPPNFGDIRGVSSSGAPLVAARFEYEVCFTCHGDRGTGRPYITRQVQQNNKRLQFDPSAISYHPVVAPSRGGDVPSLKPGIPRGSTISCSDCHGSDSGTKAGGMGPDGIHGSNWIPLLVRRYETADFTRESASAYALCYSCHDRGSILADESFPLHRLHVVENNTPCSGCHDAHGISSAQGATMNHRSLMNFDLGIVSPSRTTGRLEFQSTGPRTGACYLNCHGAEHGPREYGR